MPPPQIDPKAVFLNIPYDEEFRSLYVAYIVGLYHLGLVPHIAAEIPGGARRLERIFDLIQGCRYSIHDLSRVELSGTPDQTPRFNMPLELGMTITWQRLNPTRHNWYVWESEPYRIQRSTSDLNGTDAYIHNGTPEGILSGLRNAFWSDDAPAVPKILEYHRFVEGNVDAILKRNGTHNLFALGVFKDLCLLCSYLATLLRYAPN